MDNMNMNLYYNYPQNYGVVHPQTFPYDSPVNYPIQFSEDMDQKFQPFTTTKRCLKFSPFKEDNEASIQYSTATRMNLSPKEQNYYYQTSRRLNIADQYPVQEDIQYFKLKVDHLLLREINSPQNYSDKDTVPLEEKDKENEITRKQQKHPLQHKPPQPLLEQDQQHFHQHQPTQSRQQQQQNQQLQYPLREQRKVGRRKIERTSEQKRQYRLKRNDQERMRMDRIKNAIAVLESCLPMSYRVTWRKMHRSEIINEAMNYIDDLAEILAS